MKHATRGRVAVGLAIVAVLVLCVAATTTQRAIQVQPSGPVTRWPDKAKRWALIIGIDKYDHGQISPLSGSANDARSIRDALIENAGFPADQVILLATDQPQERQPKKNNILERLVNLKNVVPPDGLLFVSFAGHGMDRGGQAYLLPSDAKLSNDIRLLEQTALDVNTVKGLIRDIGVEQVVLVLDACRNDPGGRADQPNPMSQKFVNGFNFDLRNREVKAFATLYATAVGQRAYEYTEKKQGYFTWELVEGLRGAAANASGEVTLASLLDYVQARVPKRVLTDLGVGKEQRPFADIGGYKANELVIAFARPRTRPVETQPPAGQPSTVIPRVDPAALELSFWETIKSSKDPRDFKAYLDKFPNGTFAGLARQRANPAPVQPAQPVQAVRPVRPVPGALAAANTATSVGDGRWDWTLFIKADAATLSQIRCVEYTLHPTFPDPVRTVCTSANNFALSSNGWGTFEVKLRVMFTDGSVRQLAHQLRFE